MLNDIINKVIQEAAESLGFTIYESSIYLKGENSKIAVKIDNKGTVSHQDCEEYSNRLSFLLDKDQVLPNYSLEISSPGLQRKIESIEDYVRFKKSPVRVLVEESEIRVVYKGMMSEINDNGITLKTEDSEILLLFSKIVQTNLDY